MSIQNLLCDGILEKNYIIIEIKNNPIVIFNFQ